MTKPDAAASTRRNKPAQGKERCDPAQGYASQNTPSPEGAKQGGELTSGWKLSKLAELLTVLRGVSYKKEDASSKPASDRVPILRATNIQNGLVFEDFVHVPRRYVSDDQLLRKGDIVIAASSGSRNIVGKAAQLTTDWFGSFGTFCFGLRPKPGVHPGYLAWFLQTSEYRHQVSELSAGVNINNLRAVHIEEIPIPVAPLSEQRRIVAEIEKQFTRLEVGMAALRRVQANLKRYRAAVLKAACEGRLVPTEAELARTEGRPFESGQQLLARILTERHQNWQGRGQYKEPAAPNTANLPLIPEGWAWAPLETVSEAVGGFAFSSTKFVNEGYQVVKMANIRMGKIDLTQKPSFISDVTSDIVEKYSLREGDLVVTLTGTRKKRDYGYVAVVKNQGGLLLNQRIARVRPFAGMDSKFLQLAMQTEHYRDRFFSHETGNVGQGNVGMAAVTKEMIAFPPLAEQTCIVAEVERRLSVVEELEAVVTTNLHRATRLRQSILQKAFAGEL
jgi:type I restriction enzyme, S subunit